MAERGANSDKRQNLEDSSPCERKEGTTHHHHHYYPDCQNVTHNTKIINSNISSLQVGQRPDTEESPDQSVSGVLKEMEALELDRTKLDLVKLYQEETLEEEDDPFLAQTLNFMIKKSLEQHSLENEITKKDRISELFQKGQHYKSENKLIHSLVSFSAVAKLHKTNGKGAESVNGIAACAHEVRDVAKKMAEQPKFERLVTEHVVPVLHEMKEFIQSIDSPNRDDKVAFEAQCLFDIGLCYNYCKDFQNYADINLKATSLMQKELGSEAERYKIYGKCHNNAGRAYSKMKERSLANEKYITALEAFKNAADWKSSEEKNKFMKLARDNIEANEYRMKK